MQDLYDICSMNPESERGIVNCGHKIKYNATINEFHSHYRFEIVFFISGDVSFVIEKKVYHLKYGDLFVVNSDEIHKHIFHSGKPYERIVTHFDPAIPSLFNSPNFDMLNCFINRPKGEQNKIDLTEGQIEDVMKIFNKMVSASKSAEPGAEALNLANLIELLVFINRVFKNNKFKSEPLDIPTRLSDVLYYIEDNMDSNLTLNSLAKTFFVDRSYLSRLFKKSTGISIHEYMLFMKVAKARRLIIQGSSVIDASLEAGFNDYSNFYKIFKKIVGVSPGQFKQECLDIARNKTKKKEFGDNKDKKNGSFK